MEAPGDKLDRRLFPGRVGQSAGKQIYVLQWEQLYSFRNCSAGIGDELRFVFKGKYDQSDGVRGFYLDKKSGGHLLRRKWRNAVRWGYGSNRPGVSGPGTMERKTALV